MPSPEACGGLLPAGVDAPTLMAKAISPDDAPGGSESDSNDCSESDDKPPHPHYLKLLALSAELMRPPKRIAGKASSVVRNIGLVEEARNRRRGRKERCVHWDRVEINGKEFPLQRADTSTAPPEPATAFLTGGAQNRSIDPSDAHDPSYLLVGHSTCDMCLMTFECSSVSGVITMKRIMEARRDWGISDSLGKKYAAASNLYKLARLCTLCSQFFCSRKSPGGRGEDDLVPCGVGRSDERVSLTLESMASNKPLPDKITASTKSATILGSRLGKHGRYRRRRDPGDSRSAEGSSMLANFRLGDLIADDNLVVKETDLARQSSATATQSSTADGMGAEVCMGFMASTRLEGSCIGLPDTRSKPPKTQRQEDGVKGRDQTTLAVWTPESTIKSSMSSTTSGTRSLDCSASEDGASFSIADASVLSASVTGMPPVEMSADEIEAAAATAARTCSRTRREIQPWWEVDLGGVFPVRCIRVHHPDRRTEATKAGTSPFVDVAPFWVMTAVAYIGQATPEEAREQAISSRRFGSHGKVTVWDLGTNHFATAVRVQAEGVKSLQLARVEVIKGGGTQHAKDIIQMQLLAKVGRPSFGNRRGSTDGSSYSGTSTSVLKQSKSRRISEHTMTMRRLLRFYQERGWEGSVGPIAAATVDPTKPAASPGAADASPAIGGEPGRLGLAANGASLSASGGGGSIEACRAQTSPVPFGGSSGGSGVEGYSTSQQRRARKVNLHGEDVRCLLLRAMVGYDWVDDFNGQEKRLRGAFTEQDVVVLEDFFFRCALGDDVEARATATVSDPSLHLDPGELSGDLRRLQLQVQTNTGGKNKTPMLLAVRESPHLFQLLSSGVVEVLPDALTRAEAQLPPAQRPLLLDWARFLKVMGLCLEGAYRGVGVVTPSAVVRFFEETHDDKLDFLTRKRSRLPPPRPTDTENSTGWYNSGFGPIRSAKGGGGKRGSTAAQSSSQRVETAPLSMVGSGTGSSAIAGGTARSTTTPGLMLSSTEGGGGTSTGGEEISLHEGGGGSIDTGDDTVDASLIAAGFGSVGSRSTSRGASAAGGGGSGAGANSRRSGGKHYRGEFSSARVGGGRRGGGGGRTEGLRGGGSEALKSLLRPQARHEVFRGYGEAVVKRRVRQREALLRAPEPNLRPARAYKPCGLCQAPFPVDSLGATVSLKVLGNFLAKAGAPSERFERKASSLCGLQRLPLCIFCSQFFDPDFPDGIVPPGGFTAKKNNTIQQTGSSCDTTSTSDLNRGGEKKESRGPSRFSFPDASTNGLVPFFDDRFPNRWSDTPSPSSAPLSSVPKPEIAMMGHQNGCLFPLPSATSTIAKRGGDRFGDGGGGAGGGSSRHTVLHEAKELRVVGELVRGGCSIRDRLLLIRSET